MKCCHLSRPFSAAAPGALSTALHVLESNELFVRAMLDFMVTFFRHSFVFFTDWNNAGCVRFRCAAVKHTKNT